MKEININGKKVGGHFHHVKIVFYDIPNVQYSGYLRVIPRKLLKRTASSRWLNEI